MVNSFVPNDHWAYDNTLAVYPHDPFAANILLDLSGWALQPGNTYRKKSGKELVLTATSTNSSFRQIWLSVWENQLKECGIHLIRNHINSSIFFDNLTGLKVRDFELAEYAWYAFPDPGGRDSYACDAIPSPENNWQGRNYSGWCNPIATDAIKEANSIIVREERIPAYHQVQQELGNDVPVIPLFLRVKTMGTDPNLTGLVVSPSEYSFTTHSEDWHIPGQSSIIIGLTEEPLWLDRRMYDSDATNLIMDMVNPKGYTSIGYDYQPVLLTQIPTLESGLAFNSIMTVSTGDIVLDTSSEVRSLEPGITVFDKDGNLVTFTGSPIQMNQLTVQYLFKPGITWSDGQPLLKEDFQLGYQASCNYTEGSDFICEKVKNITFANDDFGYTATWIPGYQSSDYIYPPFSWYPAHRIITSGGPFQGMTLAEVPVIHWRNLPEVTDTPLGVGPYRIDNWEKGNQITLQAVSGYVNGNPLTPTIIFKFLDPANVEQALINGEVDVIGPKSLPELTNNLVIAQSEGKIKLLNTPTLTWERIDLNLETFAISAEINPDNGGNIQYAHINGNLLQVTIPPGAVVAPTTIELYPLAANTTPLPFGYASASNAFRLSALQNGIPISGLFPFNLPVQITVHYTPGNVDRVFIPSLKINYWNGSAWKDAKNTCPRYQQFFKNDPAAQTITVNVCHLTEFSTFG